MNLYTNIQEALNNLAFKSRNKTELMDIATLIGAHIHKTKDGLLANIAKKIGDMVR
jgi:hypothetical protein